MNRNDGVQYSFRLNLRNPDHLLVHETLHDLDLEIHKSRSAFIAETLVGRIKGAGKENHTAAGREEAARVDGCVTRAELEEELQRLEGKVMQSVSTQLTGMLLSAIAMSRATPLFSAPNIRDEGIAAEADKKGAEEALRELSGVWLDD